MIYESGWENPDHHEPSSSRPRPMFDPPPGPAPEMSEYAAQMVEIPAGALTALWNLHERLTETSSPYAKELELILNGC